MSDDPRRVFWSRTRRLTGALLAIWLLLCVLGPWFARDLNGVQLFGFPLGFWLAAQGSLLIFLALVVVYVVAMDRFEATYLAQADQRGGQTPGNG
jgi:putative solute:sodium symporter small subunit